MSYTLYLISWLKVPHATAGCLILVGFKNSRGIKMTKTQFGVFWGCRKHLKKIFFLKSHEHISLMTAWQNLKRQFGKPSMFQNQTGKRSCEEAFWGGCSSGSLLRCACLINPSCSLMHLLTYECVWVLDRKSIKKC